MSDFVLLGTDTDAGKTTLALLWLAAFADDFEYWKPVETGASDTERVRALVPAATVHPPLARFHDAVAPLLAARREGRPVPRAADIVGARPAPTRPGRRLLIETFGGPLSPLNESELQVVAVQALALPLIVVSSSAVGAIGRVLQAREALAGHGLHPAAVVLLGASDPFAVEQIQRHATGVPTFSLRPPSSWEPAAIAQAASEQTVELRALRSCLSDGSRPAAPEDLLERDRRCVWHPYTSLAEPDPPLVVAGAQDEFLRLADGRRLIDAISSWWTILHGHRHPVLMRALRDATAEFDHVLFAGVTHRPAVELAELLLKTMPWPGGRAFFSDNGSTAVEVALKMGYQYWCHQGQPRRTRFVGFEGGYHGDTFGAMAVGRDPVFFGRFEPLLFRADIVPLSAERLEETLSGHAEEVAAVIVEPLVQGAGGMRMHSPEQLRDLFDVTRRHGVLFIADEVMTGGGRTGWLWAHQAAGVAPDLVCAAKTLAGGLLPLAATLAAPHVVAAWETADPARTFFHGHSFTAHPVACAVAVANWKLLPRPEARAMKVFWEDALGGLRRSPGVREVRVCGSIAAVELDVPGGYLASVGRRLRRACLEQGVFLRPLGNVLYAMPPLGTSADSLRRIADAMSGAVEGLS